MQITCSGYAGSGALLSSVTHLYESRIIVIHAVKCYSCPSSVSQLYEQSVLQLCKQSVIIAQIVCYGYTSRNVSQLYK